MADGRPRVSIGVPVYNGEAFISQALDSILAQTYTDLEVIISDNGSTDGTQDICRAYEARDSRISYHRSDQNLGASWNFNRTVELSSGEYFKWVAHDDMLAPSLIEKCVEVLDQQPAVVLCFPWLMDIDAEGNEIRVRKSTVRLDAARPHERFRELSAVRPSFSCEEVFGLIRMGILKRTRLIDNYSDSDRTLLAELGLYGPFYEIPEVLFLHRLHGASSVRTHPGRQDRMAWFNPKARRIVLPHWRQFFGLLEVIGRGPIAWNERILCFYHMVGWLKRTRRRLWNDITWAVKQVL